MTDHRVDALIVTALQIERRAVREHLTSLEIIQIGAVTLDVGDFETDNGTQRVAIVEVGPGNIDASVLTTITATELQPPVTLMVGIAGGVKDLRLGDVVASSKVYWAESGKSLDHEVRTRPDLGTVSPALVQLARQVAADDRWQERIRPDTARDRLPQAIVAPIVAGERVVASSQSEDAKKIRQTFGDAVAVAMEDFGVTRASAIRGASETIAIRSASDLLDGKSEADVAGSQPVASAHAAAFAFELLALSRRLRPPATGTAVRTDFYAHAATLYPKGPIERGIWERAGGDLSTITLAGTGRSMWWSALRDLEQGGGGHSINFMSLIVAMREDYPTNEMLARVDAARK